MAYDHTSIETTWQQRWETDGLYRSRVDWDRPKHYAVTMLPYPSGDLHIGHWYAMTPSDARARMMRMKGFNVLFPMGFDAFGLPAENAAVQRNIHPAEWTSTNIERMRLQLRSMGAMFDWERETVSCEPSYYRWTEWFFKKFFEDGIAYRSEAMVNWSPTLQTVLANEQVIDGRDERTGQPVIQKLMEQWFFAITRYVDELLNFDTIDWPEPIRAMQTNWIGLSEGATVSFPTEAGDAIKVFTTRPDTLWGATFMVLAPEHALVDALTSDEQSAEVAAYREQASRQSELERMENSGDKTGVFTGGYATNPATGRQIPVWIADYVLVSYGTGAIMAVPAHDERDFEFARLFGLEVTPVIVPSGGEPLDGATMTEAYSGPGMIVDSGPLDGIAATTAKGRSNPAIAAAIEWVEANGAGQESRTSRLRDWLISRQRYWGSPIPIIHRSDGGIETVPDADLPVVLPEDVEFEGRSPLGTHQPFLEVTDSDGNPGRRETDTMDTFMCSSWYWFRYLSPRYEDGPFDPEEAAYWLPVDMYTGGAEHAVMHLLYARFFVKALRDGGVFAETETAMREHGRNPEGLFDEPFLMLRNQGQVLGEERSGDVVEVEGTADQERVVAEVVRVVQQQFRTKKPEGGMLIEVNITDRIGAADSLDAGTQHVGGIPPGRQVIQGEIVRRTENVIHVDTGERVVTVEVPEDAVVDIPSIPGRNDVTQLRHHLEVQRMSKSKGNTVNPDDLVARHGADTLRTYLMFAFEWQKGGPWDSRGIMGSRRFIEDIWKIGVTEYLADTVDADADAALRRRVHQTITKVGDDLTEFKWNTAVAALMSLRNDLLDTRRRRNVSADVWTEAVETTLKLLAPIAPHITEELWRRLGHDSSVHVADWPVADADAAREDTVTMVLQVNGKVRDRVEVSASISEEDAVAVALASDKVQTHTGGQPPRHVVARPPKIVNVVV